MRHRWRKLSKSLERCWCGAYRVSGESKRYMLHINAKPQSENPVCTRPRSLPTFPDVLWMKTSSR